MCELFWLLLTFQQSKLIFSALSSFRQTQMQHYESSCCWIQWLLFLENLQLPFLGFRCQIAYYAHFGWYCAGRFITWFTSHGLEEELSIRVCSVLLHSDTQVCALQVPADFGSKKDFFCFPPLQIASQKFTFQCVNFSDFFTPIY